MGAGFFLRGEALLTLFDRGKHAAPFEENYYEKGARCFARVHSLSSIELYRHQPPFHPEHFRDGCLQCHGNFIGEKNRRIRRTTLDAHDRLTADTYSESQFFLCHSSVEAKAADIILETGWHGGGSEKVRMCGGDCTVMNEGGKGTS